MFLWLYNFLILYWIIFCCVIPWLYDEIVMIPQFFNSITLWYKDSLVPQLDANIPWFCDYISRWLGDSMIIGLPKWFHNPLMPGFYDCLILWFHVSVTLMIPWVYDSKILWFHHSLTNSVQIQHFVCLINLALLKSKSVFSTRLFIHNIERLFWKEKCH